jgi:hypothetical protein
MIHTCIKGSHDTLLTYTILYFMYQLKRNCINKKEKTTNPNTCYLFIYFNFFKVTEVSMERGSGTSEKVR